MKKCECYNEQDRILGWITSDTPKTERVSLCYGTRELEPCTCGGDRTKCNFYPEVRERAIKEVTTAKKPPMQWNVLRYNINTRKIVEYNIFEHGGFADDVDMLLKSNLLKDDFAEELRKLLMRYFWAKCEHEVIVAAWPPSHSDMKRKIDVYTQVILNFGKFVDYVWDYSIHY